MQSFGTWPTATSPWTPLGSGNFNPGDPIVTGTDLSYLFGLGHDGRLWTYGLTDQGTPWNPYSPGEPTEDWRQAPAPHTFPTGTPLAGIQRTRTEIDLFAVDNLGQLHIYWWSHDQRWGQPDWEPISHPQLAARARLLVLTHMVENWPNQDWVLDLFGSSPDGYIYHLDWTPQHSWTDWQRLGSREFPEGTAVGGIWRDSDNLDIFAVGSDAHIYTMWFSTDRGWSTDWTLVFPDGR